MKPRRKLRSKKSKSSKSQTGVGGDEVFEDSDSRMSACSDGGMGYTRWGDLVADVVDINSNERSEPFVLCGMEEFDGGEDVLEINHHNTTISCSSTECSIEGAKVLVGSDLENIELEGLDFVSQSGEICNGDNSNLSITGCTFKNTKFGTKELKSAVISTGYLNIKNSTFEDNVGFGAVLVSTGTATIQNCRFIRNGAAVEDRTGSAIQIGQTRKTVAEASISDSCFDENYGGSIVLVRENATVTSNSGNAVMSDTANPKPTCLGVKYSDTEIECDLFEHQSESCEDLDSIEADDLREDEDWDAGGDTPPADGIQEPDDDNIFRDNTNDDGRLATPLMIIGFTSLGLVFAVVAGRKYMKRDGEDQQHLELDESTSAP